MDKNYQKPRIGLSFNPNIRNIVNALPELVDYIEIPYELLEHDSASLEMKNSRELILHCASLSIAGNVRADDDTINRINKWLVKTDSPWLGEHLSYITSEKEGNNFNGEPYAKGQPYNIGFTVPPPMNAASVDSISESLEFYIGKIVRPLIIENPPLYFNIPGSSISQTDFIGSIIKNTGVGMLLDIAHFLISAKNMQFDPFERIKLLPLDKVVEIHMSGIQDDDGIFWDNHAGVAPKEEWELLSEVLKVATPKAITFEYNWDARMSIDIIASEINTAKKIIGFYESVEE